MSDAHAPLEAGSMSSDRRQRRPRASEWLSLFTLAALLGYVMLFALNWAEDGLGWGLAMLGLLFAFFGAPVLIFASVVLFAVSFRRRTARERIRALSSAVAALALEALVLASPHLRPRGPLG
jgi:hypothetical protein